MTATTAQTVEPQARRSGFYFKCCVCQGQVHMTEAKASGWQGRRLVRAASQPKGTNGLTWWCPKHVPADLPPPARSRFKGEDQKQLRVEPLGPRRRMLVYARETVAKRLLVFAFSLADIAAAAGRSEAWTRRELRTSGFDPLDLRDLLRWIGQRPANKPPVDGGAFDSFAAPAGRKVIPREQVVQGFASIGLEVKPLEDRRLLEVMGDKVTTAAAQRLLEHMKREGLASLPRSQARAVMLLGFVPARSPDQSPRRQRRVDRVVAELAAQLDGAKVSSRDAGTVAVDGLVFALDKAEDLLAALRAPKRRAQIQDALRVLSGYRGAAAKARKKVRKKVADAKRKKLKQLSGRATAAG